MSIEHIFDRYVSMACLDDLCSWMKSVYNHSYLIKLFLCHKVNLVDDECGAELYLLDKKTLNVFFLNLIFLQKLLT